MAQRPDHAANKRAVATGLKRLFEVPEADLESAVAAVYADDARLFAFHPVNEQQGVRDIAARLWGPIRHALPDAERRALIVSAGEFQGKNFVTTLSMLQGTFERDWLDIPANHEVVTLRCCEIHQVGDDGKIVESHILIDVLDLMLQADCWPIAPSTGTERMWQAPSGGGGVQLDAVEPDTGAANLKLVKSMHAGLMMFDGESLESMEHAHYWTPNFMWYGTAGIGTTRGLRGFEAHHQIPFLRAFPNRKVAKHIANVGDGAFVTTGGWPSVVATHTGPDWLGTGPTGKPIDMRVMDFYRIEDGLIAENWVPIDLPHILLQKGTDIFGRMRHRRGMPRRDLSEN